MCISAAMTVKKIVKEGLCKTKHPTIINDLGIFEPAQAYRILQLLATDEYILISF